MGRGDNRKTMKMRRKTARKKLNFFVSRKKLKLVLTSNRFTYFYWKAKYGF